MINKEEMLVLLRSVAVPDDVEQGMGHAFDLGVDWERTRVEKILRDWLNGIIVDSPHETVGLILQDVLNGVSHS